ncbi:MAG: TlpA family protein disulfide reductase [Ilumatobacter sp.]|nr:TlpA family protein disulfide reductase [Ilumatobacter sp.]
MIARRATAAMAVCVAVVGVGCSGGDESSSLPDVEIVSLDGTETTSLADLEGPAVINLWATWCAPCRREIPAFEEVHQARSDEVRFVGINVGEDADVAAEYLAEVGATYDQFSDSAGYVVTELDTTAMPVTIVIDANGNITERKLGPMDEDDLNVAIDEALAST